MPKYVELRSRLGSDGERRGGGVYRKTVEPLDHRGRRIVVGLEPGDIISFREERCQRKYTLDIKWAYRQAVKQAVDKARADKAEQSGRKVVRRVKRGIL